MSYSKGVYIRPVIVPDEAVSAYLSNDYGFRVIAEVFGGFSSTKLHQHLRAIGVETKRQARPLIHNPDKMINLYKKLKDKTSHGHLKAFARRYGFSYEAARYHILKYKDENPFA